MIKNNFLELDWRENSYQLFSAGLYNYLNEDEWTLGFNLFKGSLYLRLPFKSNYDILSQNEIGYSFSFTTDMIHINFGKITKLFDYPFMWKFQYKERLDKNYKLVKDNYDDNHQEEYFKFVEENIYEKI